MIPPLEISTHHVVSYIFPRTRIIHLDIHHPLHTIDTTNDPPDNLLRISKLILIIILARIHHHISLHTDIILHFNNRHRRIKFLRLCLLLLSFRPLNKNRRNHHNEPLSFSVNGVFNQVIPLVTVLSNVGDRVGWYCLQYLSY